MRWSSTLRTTTQQATWCRPDPRGRLRTGPRGGLDQSIRIEMFGDLHEFGGLGRVVTKEEALKVI